MLIGNLPAARVGDMLTCVGPPDVIAMGSQTVLIGNMTAARIGDLTAHGGSSWSASQGDDRHARPGQHPPDRSPDRRALLRALKARLGASVEARKETGELKWDMDHDCLSGKRNPGHPRGRESGCNLGSPSAWG